MARVGFVGLGVMGSPMAGHLLTAGHDLTVWNRTAAKAEPLAARGARVSSTLEELPANCDVVCLCVSKTEDVESCLSRMRGSAEKGTLFIDHSTIQPQATKRLHDEMADAGLRFLDAPITGGSKGAADGTLTIFCGGGAQEFDVAKPILEAYAKNVALVGGPGKGQTMKMANQIAVAGSLLGLCESLAFAKKAGLDIAQTRELLSGGAAGSWAFDNYGQRILDGDWSPGFTVKNQRKDFGYCVETAAQIGASLPGTELVDRLLQKLEQSGHGEWTTAALYEVLMELDGDS